MRRRLLTALWVAVIMTTIAVLVRVPGLRERIVAPEPNFLALAEEQSDDPVAWLVAFSFATPNDVGVPEMSRRYQRAAEADPTNPAPHVLFALRFLPYTLRRSERWPSQDAESETVESLEEETLTPQLRENLVAAEMALPPASELDPGNATVDYLRAYAAFADHRDEEAVAHLRSVLGKQSWNTYARDRTIALYETGLRHWSQPVAAARALDARLTSSMICLDLSKLLVGLGLRAQRARDHARAILLYESAMQLSELMLANAYDMTEESLALSARSDLVWRAARAIETEDAEQGAATDKIVVAAEAVPTPADRETSKWYSPALADYFSSHGRDDLAEELASWASTMDPIADRLRLQRDSENSRENRLDLISRLMGWAEGALAGSLLLLVVSAFGAAVLWLLRRPVREITWPRWGWLLLLVSCLAAAAGVGLVWDGQPFLARYPPEFIEAANQMLEALGGEPWSIPLGQRPWGSYFVVVTLPLLALATLAVVLRHRRRHPETRGTSAAGQWLGTLLPLLLPLTALLSLSTLGLAMADAAAAERQGEIDRAIIYGGDALLPTEPEAPSGYLPLVVLGALVALWFTLTALDWHRAARTKAAAAETGDAPEEAALTMDGRRARGALSTACAVVATLVLLAVYVILWARYAAQHAGDVDVRVIPAVWLVLALVVARLWHRRWGRVLWMVLVATIAATAWTLANVGFGGWRLWGDSDLGEVALFLSPLVVAGVGGGLLGARPAVSAALIVLLAVAAPLPFSLAAYAADGIVGWEACAQTVPPTGIMLEVLLAAGTASLLAWRRRKT